MDSSTQPLYVQDHTHGDVFQVLNVIKNRHEGENESLSSVISFDEEQEEEDIEDIEEAAEENYILSGAKNFKVLDMFLEVYKISQDEISNSIFDPY